MFGAELFRHPGKSVATAVRREIDPDNGHGDRRVRAQRSPRKFTPFGERNTRPGAGMGPRTARADGW